MMGVRCAPRFRCVCVCVCVAKLRLGLGLGLRGDALCFLCEICFLKIRVLIVCPFVFVGQRLSYEKIVLKYFFFRWLLY